MITPVNFRSRELVESVSETVSRKDAEINVSAARLRAERTGRSRLRAYFSTLGCPDLRIGDVLDLCERHRFDGVEIRTLAGTTNILAAMRDEFGDPETARRRLGPRAALIKIFAISLRLAEPTEAHRQEVSELLPWAKALGVRWLRVMDGGSATEADSHDRMLCTIGWWRRLRHEMGVDADLIVETHDSLVTADRIVALAKKAPDVGILWDPHNTWKRSQEDYLEMAPMLAGWISHLHLKDSVGTASDPGAFAYVLPGAGDFRGRELVDALRQHGYRGAISMEWERHWHRDLPPITPALECFKARWWPETQ